MFSLELFGLILYSYKSDMDTSLSIIVESDGVVSRLSVLILTYQDENGHDGSGGPQDMGLVPGRLLSLFDPVQVAM